MLLNCDLTGMLEDGGIGVVIGGIVAWVIKHFFFNRSASSSPSTRQ